MEYTNSTSVDFEVKPLDPRDREALEQYYKNIGQRLKKARLDDNLSQYDLAQHFGLGTTAISNYENGLRQMPIHLLVEMCAFFGKPMNYFLGPEVEPLNILSKEIKKTVERFTSAHYIEIFWELKDGSLVDVEKPLPLLPLPPEIAEKSSFVIRDYKKETNTYNYYLFKFYKPKVKKGILKIGQKEYIDHAADDWVLAEIGDTKKWEITQFKNITPSSKRKYKGDKEVNISAIMVAKIERLVE